jgi:hypothetical protein
MAGRYGWSERPPQLWSWSPCPEPASFGVVFRPAEELHAVGRVICPLVQA